MDRGESEREFERRLKGEGRWEEFLLVQAEEVAKNGPAGVEIVVARFAKPEEPKDDTGRGGAEAAAVSGTTSEGGCAAGRVEAEGDRGAGEGDGAGMRGTAADGASGGPVVAGAGGEVELTEAPEVVESVSPDRSDRDNKGEVPREKCRALPTLNDAAWVYHNLGRHKVRRSEAPSEGAWHWLVVVRSGGKAAKRAFYREMLPRLLPKEEARASRADDDDPLLVLIDRVRSARERALLRPGA